jgi:thioredoxin 1
MKKCFFLLLSLSLFTVGYAQETDFDELLASDVNGDGIVNILDLTFVASHFGETPIENQYPNPDVNRDGTVDIFDLVKVANHFGRYSGIPLGLTDKTFDSVVLNAKLPVLVEFWSASCIYCLLMKPIVADVALEYRDAFAVAKLEVNRNPEKTAEYHIRGTPLYLLFYEGKVVRVIVGAMPKERLVNRILEGLSTVVEPPLTQEQTDSE